MRREKIVLPLVVAFVALGPGSATAQESEPVPPPPPAQQSEPVPPPPAQQTAPPPTMTPVTHVPVSTTPVAPNPAAGTVPVYQINPNARATRTLPNVVPIMLGTGLAVLGGFTIAGTTAIIVDNDLSDISGDGVTAITLAYIFGAAFSVFGLYLAIGGLADAVHIESYHPGWAWTAAIASILGAGFTIAAVTTAFVDDDIGDDTIMLGIAGGAFYLATLLALVGLDNTGSTTVAIAPLPFEGGAGLAIAGQL